MTDNQHKLHLIDRIHNRIEVLEELYAKSNSRYILEQIEELYTALEKGDYSILERDRE